MYIMAFIGNIMREHPLRHLNLMNTYPLPAMKSKTKRGGKISSEYFKPMVQPQYVQLSSGNIPLEIAKILLPLAGSFIGSLLVKKGAEAVNKFLDKDKNGNVSDKELEILKTVNEKTVDDILNKLQVNNKQTDNNIQKSISEKSKSILSGIIRGSGISYI